MRNDEQQERFFAKLKRELGTTITLALEDPSVIEIMVNPDGSIWIERLGKGMERNAQKMARENLLAALGTIASLLETRITDTSPIIEGELPLDGSRVEGMIPPVVENPCLVIRRRASAVFPLSRYLKEERITDGIYRFLRTAILEKKNILIAGGTGSGKTTFTNAILNELALLSPNERLVIMEDTVELQCSMENKLSMRTTDTVNMNKLLRTAMRSRPDRIIVGEVRGGEALDLLKSWNTGHPGGVATLHANSAEAALIRLEQLISEVNQHKMPELIAEAIDVIIYLQRYGQGGPRVTDVIKVIGFNGVKYDTISLMGEDDLSVPSILLQGDKDLSLSMEEEFSKITVQRDE